MQFVLFDLDDALTDPHNDVLGSAGVGMQPIWLAGVPPWPEGVARPGHRIDRIEEVMPAVMGDRD